MRGREEAANAAKKSRKREELNWTLVSHPWYSQRAAAAAARCRLCRSLSAHREEEEEEEGDMKMFVCVFGMNLFGEDVFD